MDDRPMMPQRIAPAASAAPARHDAPALRYTNATVVFPDGTRAADGVDLTVPQGQVCVLLGSSGAGKSTLIGMVNGLVTPTAGTVTFAGTAIEKKSLPTVQRRTGMVHQQLHLVPRLTVLANVLSGALSDIPFSRALFKLFPRPLQRKACALLEEVELEEKHLYRRASALSGGQQQRVAIARAFVTDPYVVLADEPVASLDPVVSRHVLRLLCDASRQRGTTVLCSLHQVEFAVEFADRIVGLRQGRVVFDGPPSALDPSAIDRIYGRSSTAPEIAAARVPAAVSA